MVLITTVPDKEWIEEPATIGFEVPDEVGQILASPLASREKKEKAAAELALRAYRATERVIAHPHAFGWEIVSKPGYPRLAQRDLVQETVEEVEVRRIEGKTLPEVTDVQRRNMENWTIEVWGRRRKMVFPKQVRQFGPKEGFEAFEDLHPAYKDHVKPIYEQEAS